MRKTALDQIVVRARNGDAQAFTELVRRYQHAVFGAAYERVLDFETARDIAQETFVRAYERLRDLREPAAFPAWLLSICRNLAASWQRSPRRHVGTLQAHSLGTDGPAQLATADPAERIATRDLVSRALSALPENNRLALTLFLVDGYTYAEVADLTGVSRTTVKGRIERGRRQLETEVLAMTEDTLKGEAPDEQFTLHTLKSALEKACDAAADHEMADARALAEDVLDHLPELEAEENERREVEFEALAVVAHSAFFPDRERWTNTRRRQIRMLEQMGDRERLAIYLENFGFQAGGLTKSERFAIADYCLGLYEQLEMHAELRAGLFFRGWHLIIDEQYETGRKCFERAKQLDEQLPYDKYAACLDATREFRRLTGDHIDMEGRLRWGVSADVGRLAGERMIHRSSPGWGFSHGSRDELARTEHGFRPFSHVGWLPVTGPPVGFEQQVSNHSFTPHPTTTRVWVEADDETVTTPAGEFSSCLLVRASTRQAPEDRGSDRPEAELNKAKCGQWYWWFAPGVGPVAFRHEADNGITKRTVLSRFDCPQEREGWIPLVVGTRWEYKPADPPEDFDVQMVVQLTHIDDDGMVYLPKTVVANRNAQ